MGIRDRINNRIESQVERAEIESSAILPAVYVGDGKVQRLGQQPEDASSLSSGALRAGQSVPLAAGSFTSMPAPRRPEELDLPRARPSAVTILYRLDFEVEGYSEIWIAEGTRQRLLGTYPHNNFDFAALQLRTTVAGVLRETAASSSTPAELASARPVVAEPDEEGNASFISSNSLPFSGSNPTSGETFSVSATAMDLAANSQTFDFSGNTGEVRWAVPAGEYRGTAALSSSTVEIQPETAADNSETSLLLKHELESPSFQDDNFATPYEVPLNELSETALVFRGVSAVSISGGGPHNIRTTFALQSVNFTHRPTGYLSKIKATRFAGIEYFDDDGNFAIDYYSVGAGLSFSKQTFTYPNAPIPDAADPCNFFIDKKTASTPYFTQILLGGVRVSPANNIDEGAIVAIQFDQTSFTHPIAQKQSYQKTVGGQSVGTVDINGLGLTPSKIIAVADFAES